MSRLDASVIKKCYKSEPTPVPNYTRIMSRIARYNDKDASLR